MPTRIPLFQETFQHMVELTRAEKLRRTAVRRLALLVTGLLAAQSCSLNRIAAELLALGLTRAEQGESIARRLRRTLGDARLTAATCSEPVVKEAVDWTALRATAQPLVLIVDESTRRDQTHLLRVSLADRGGAVPLVWAAWEQNTPQPEHAYWAQVDAVLARVVRLIPADVAVVVVADRAFDIPPLSIGSPSTAGTGSCAPRPTVICASATALATRSTWPACSAGT